VIEKIKMYRILQTFNKNKLKNIPEMIYQEFKAINLDQKIKPGMKIGITVGSRGISNLQLIIKTIIEEVKKRKGTPFILPAMGSHGNANAEGQKQVLKSYGITEENMGVSINATLDVVELGKLENGLPVYFDKYALQADGIIAVNRIKVHTVYKAEVESGLCKMLAVGLGNHKGATSIHSLGPKYIPDNVINSARIILKKAPIMCGLGILENAYDNTSKVKAAIPEDFFKVDKELLIESKANLPSLPVSNIDILILEEMGKDISGAGMDTNITGGVKAYKEGNYNPPQIKKIIVLDLTLESHGNALGVGIADIITKKLYKKIDFEVTYKNVITCGYLDRAKIPIIADTDEKAIKIALRTSYNLPGIKPSIIIIRNTLKLDKIIVSESIWDKIKHKNNISTIGGWEKLTFDSEGNLTTKI
jgi:nickel-dependent lactate racemase